MTTHVEAMRLSLGAYVLGTLEPAEHDEVERHLVDCADCRAEIAELDVVVPALAMLTPEDVSPPPLPPDLFDRVASAVRADEVAPARPHRGPRRWLLVAAAGVLLAGAGTATGLTLTSSAPPATTVGSAESGAVGLRVSASDAGPGTRLVLTARGLPAHEHCTLRARAADGSDHAAGTWDADYDGDATVVETTDVPRAHLRSVTLFGSRGQRLVTVSL